MNQQSSIQNSNTKAGPSDFFDLKKLMLLMLRNWYWYIIALAFCSSGAYFYIKYSLPIYRVSCSILIEGGEQTSLPGLDNQLLEGFGISPGSQNLDNQILILSSRTLIRESLEELPFDIDIYSKGLFKTVSYYPLIPLRLEPGSEGAPLSIEFAFEYYDENVYRLSAASNSGFRLDTLIAFGEDVDLSTGSFVVYPERGLEEIYKSEEKLYFSFYNLRTQVESYRKRLSVQSATKEGTIINLSLEGTNRARDIVFLDKIVEVYLRNNLEKKNHEARRIIEFIDEQLVDVSDSLIMTENRLQEFRSRNRIMDVSAQAQQIIDQAVILDDKKARLTLEANYYGYLDEYLNKDSSKEVPISPSTMGIEDPLLGTLMQELSGLQAEYFSSGVGERNPLQSQLELRIRNTKQSIGETLQGIKQANSMALNETKLQIRKLNEQASGLPVKERQLLGIERKFNLNNVLYTYLLQKRAEAQIQKASNKPDIELIDSAEADHLPLAPNKIMVYLLAVILGGAIPFLAIIIREGFLNKISSEDALKSITDLPIVGQIPHSRLSYNTVVLTEPQSKLAEAFRSLRTRMEFFTREAANPIVLVTSSMPGDGKTFTAVNLASAYSLTGKKTLIIGFDLRRPTLSKSFSINRPDGLSTYLIGKCSIEDAIFKTDFDNLHVIPSGPIPPNPGELSSTEKVKELFEELRKRYDFIIVDTAPIGTVSDNYFAADIADATLILVRHGKTNKHFLKSTIMEAQAYGINGLSLLLNDIRYNKGSSRYAYSYKYEYKQR